MPGGYIIQRQDPVPDFADSTQQAQTKCQNPIHLSGDCVTPILHYYTTTTAVQQHISSKAGQSIDLKGEESDTTGSDGCEAHAEGVGRALEGAGRAAHGGVTGGHGGAAAVGGRGAHRGGGGHGGRGGRGGDGGRGVGADTAGERWGLLVLLTVALKSRLADAVGDAVDLCRGMVSVW